MINSSDKPVMHSDNDVDESYANAGRSSGYSREQRRELDELQAELRRLRLAAQGPSRSGSPRYKLPSSAEDMRQKVERQIRLQPLASVALAAVVGFVYGIAR